MAEPAARGSTSHGSSGAASVRTMTPRPSAAHRAHRPVPRHRPISRHPDRSSSSSGFVWNTATPRSWRFDPYTFTFLTLVLSLQAAYAAPLILLAQNRQDDRDRVNLDADRDEARQSKADLEYLAREIAAIRMALGEVATRDFLRSELTRIEANRDAAREEARSVEVVD